MPRWWKVYVLFFQLNFDLRRLDFVLYVVYCISFALKQRDGYLEASKMLFACNTFVLYVRFLRLFAKHPRLGPMFLMMRAMLVGRVYFLLLVFPLGCTNGRADGGRRTW